MKIYLGAVVISLGAVGIIPSACLLGEQAARTTLAPTALIHASHFH
ncbi:MAG: hypothetical protein JWP36_2285 [Paucimonas sp.]|nr:hypothetical protein [Paucimonas sp.]